MPTKEFERDFLVEETRWGSCAVETIDGDDRRWSKMVTIIFRDPEVPENLYQVEVDEGLTENQDDDWPWGYHGWGEAEGTWPCEQVEQYQETIVVNKYRVSS